MVDEDPIGSLERVSSQEPLGNVVQQVDGEAFGALGHGRDAEVRAVRDQCGEQSSVGFVSPRPVPRQRHELAREAAPSIDLDEQLLDPDLR